jgi:arginyl-tRNA synthetase
LLDEEKEVIKLLTEYPLVIDEAGIALSPAVLANYIYELVKSYNHFYQTIPILIETDEKLKNMRLAMSANVAKVIRSSMKLLGVEVPERM